MAVSRFEHPLAIVFVVGVVLYRAGVFVLWPQAHFDADSAVTGLMALHISEGRAFPVFWYGQSYMLAVEAYLAAPLFWIAGPSVTALKLPLLAINIAVAVLLLRIFVRDAGLRPAMAIVPVLFFALPAPGTGARITEANGGNVEPFLYVLLIWILRARPVWCGVVLGLGFLQREFTIYGFLALLAMDVLRGELFTRQRAVERLSSFAVAGLLWALVQWVKRFSSGAGPGTSLADVYNAQSNVFELAGRICLDLGATLGGVPKLAAVHWPALFGTERLALTDFGIDSTLLQGWAGIWMVLALLLGSAAAWIVVTLGRSRVWPRAFDPCVYLVIVAGLSMTGYLVGRCGTVDFYYMRYDLLALLGAAGLAAGFFAARPSRMAAAAWIVVMCIWLAFPVAVYARLWHEYLTSPPPGGKQIMIQHLDVEGYRYVFSDYWIAYTISFLTKERIIAAATDVIRIAEYNRIVNEHRGEAIRIGRRRCDGGREVSPGVWFCPP
jgi:hypothetical protein